MKALFKRDNLLCVIVDDTDDMILLEPVNGDEDERFWVSYGDQNLILDPTDDEVAGSI